MRQLEISPYGEN